MIWHKELYVTDNLKNIEKLKWKIEHHAGLINVFVIVLSPQEGETFQIISNAQFSKKYMRKKEFYAIGLARGIIHSRVLIGKIFEDVYQKTGNYHVKEYFLSEQMLQENLL